MKKKTSVRIKVCMLVGTFLLLGSGVPANAKAVPKLSRKKVTVTVGKKAKLKVKNGKGKKILWKSTNKKIATVKEREKIQRSSKRKNPVRPQSWLRSERKS